MIPKFYTELHNIRASWWGDFTSSYNMKPLEMHEKGFKECASYIAMECVTLRNIKGILWCTRSVKLCSRSGNYISNKLMSWRIEYEPIGQEILFISIMPTSIPNIYWKPVILGMLNWQIWRKEIGIFQGLVYPYSEYLFIMKT